MTDPIRVHIRWMIHRDMPEILAIEAESFELPWLEKDFIRCLRQKSCIGMVAEYDDRIVGFMLYKLHKRQTHILDFAVAADSRRRTVGSQLVAKLKGRLSVQRRHRLMLEIRERNVGGQLWFQSQGFRCVSVLRDFYEATGEDAYVMQYRLGDEREQWQSQNRVSKWLQDTQHDAGGGHGHGSTDDRP